MTYQNINLILSSLIQNMYKLEFISFINMLYENECIITGSIISYIFNQWENFMSDLDLWIRIDKNIDIKKNRINSFLSIFGYQIDRIDYSNKKDKSEFSRLIESVEHYILRVDKYTTRFIDVVYIKDIPKIILENSDFTLCRNYLTVSNSDFGLKIELISSDTKSLFDLSNKIININLTSNYLSPYEAIKKKLRFEKYLSRGFSCNPILQSMYLEYLDYFIKENTRQKNGIGLSYIMISLIKEIKKMSNECNNIITFNMIKNLQRDKLSDWLNFP